MDRYIGIDPHLPSCVFVVLSKTGKLVVEQPVETNGQALTSFVRGIPGRKHVCIEEGTYSEWLYEIVQPLVGEVVVIQPKKRRGSKSDRVDAWELADKLRKGDLEGFVYKAPGKFAALREAVRAHRMLQGDVVRVKQRLRALYRSRGVSGLGNAIYTSDDGERQECLGKLGKRYRSLGEMLCRELDGIMPTYELAEENLNKEGKRTRIVRRIATAPGIGIIRACQIVATVVTPHRFRNKRLFWSYCGLGIITRTSSEWVKDRSGQWIRQRMPLPRGLNRNRNPILKNAFKGAATTVIGQMPNHPLHQSYQQQLENGTKPNLAKLTLARRIAAAVLAMWKNQEDYDQAKHQSGPR